MAAPRDGEAWLDRSLWSSSLTRAEMAGKVRRVNELGRPRRIVESAERDPWGNDRIGINARPEIYLDRGTTGIGGLSGLSGLPGISSFVP